MTRSLGLVFCLLGALGAILLLLVFHPVGSVLPLLLFLLILYCRRCDLPGAVLFIAFLCLGGALLYGLSLLALRSFLDHPSSAACFIASLFLFIEMRLFLDNEYSDGRAGRSTSFLLLALGVATFQAVLLLLLPPL